MSYTEKVQQLEQAAMTQTPMPQYQCHKKVWALKIKAVEIVRPTIAELEAILRSDPDSPEPVVVGAIITPEDNSFGQFGVPKSYVDKHDPQAGGYYVVYEDGYKSYSPAKAFEEGYTRL
jgi:hypothetical protein